MDGLKPKTPHGRLPRCSGTNRRGEQCRRPAGWGTDHVGEGKCRNHGGASVIKHGRYSTVTRTRIRELYEKFEADPNPLDLHPELAKCRAILVDFIERYDEWKEAFLAWHASFGTPDGTVTDTGQLVIRAAKPRQVLDISDARNTLLAIAKIVEVIERIKGNVSRSDLLRIMAEMGRAVDHEVTDDAVRERIKNHWMEIRIA